MRTVWKLTLDYVDGDQSFDVPKDAVFLHAHDQHGKPCVWFLCDPKAEREAISLFVCGTGHPTVPERGRYVGTVHTRGGTLVFHIFLVTNA